MEWLSGPVIVAIISTTAAIFLALWNTYRQQKITKEKNDSNYPLHKANATRITGEAYKDVIEMQSKRIDSLLRRVEKLEKKIEAWEESDLKWQREYRVLWDGNNENMKQIIELGDIPAFKPPMKAYRGKLVFNDED